MSNDLQSSTPPKRQADGKTDGDVDNAVWLAARTAYRRDEPPEALEATLLARFGELRAELHAAAKQAEAKPATVQEKPQARWWQRALSLTRLHPAFAGGLSMCLVLAVSAPWWLQWMSATPESTTPFMLVSEPSGGQLNVAQMVRVSVAREAMLDFGIPVPPQKLQESVRAEMLLGPRGEMLAVRFIERPAKKRFSFD
jgi:hypothetical protein